MRLYFLEDRAQVAAVCGDGARDPDSVLVALTAEALEALEALGVPHEPVSRFADTRILAGAEPALAAGNLRLMTEIERYVKARHPPADVDGPGFLTGQVYWTQVAATSLLTRSFLMCETIRALRPSAVTVFAGPVDRDLSDLGWERNPWVDVLAARSELDGFRLMVLPALVQEAATASRPGIQPRLAPRLARRGTRRLAALFYRVVSLARPSGRDALRLLVVDPGYDWLPVLRILGGARGATAYSLGAAPGRRRGDATAFSLDSELKRMWRRERTLLAAGTEIDDAEVAALARLFDAWFADETTDSSLEVLGIDLMPALAPLLRTLVVESPGLARHADRVASAALDVSRPDAVCFFAMPWLSAKRLAHEARKRGVPVVCYQHGGAYGTHLWDPHQFAEWADADYFLTYGEGIRPPREPLLPLRAQFVAVGAARIDAWFDPDRLELVPDRPSRRVLWIAETSVRNTTGTNLLEDTSRYLLESECLDALSAAGLSVTYRPYWGQEITNGVLGRLRRAGPSAVRVDSSRHFLDLVRAADVVVTDTSSGTVWSEVIATGKPMLLFCDPLQTRLDPEFAADLARACCWCATREAMLAAVARVARGDTAILTEMMGHDRTTFVRRYVVHQGDCAARVVSFLDEVCRGGVAVPEWDADPGRSDRGRR